MRDNPYHIYWKEGYDAYLDNNFENPYDSDSPEYYWWDVGQNDAMWDD